MDARILHGKDIDGDTAGRTGRQLALMLEALCAMPNRLRRRFGGRIEPAGMPA